MFIMLVAHLFIVGITSYKECVKMGNWGENVDYEAKGLKEYEGRFTLNFKKIYMDVDEISQRTLEVTDKHPKDSLMKLWLGAMIGTFCFALFTYQVLAVVTLPFICFYFMALLRIGKCWKGFKYNIGTYWAMTIPGLAVMIVGGLFLQQVLLKFIP